MARFCASVCFAAAPSWPVETCSQIVGHIWIKDNHNLYLTSPEPPHLSACIVSTTRGMSFSTFLYLPTACIVILLVLLYSDLLTPELPAPIATPERPQRRPPGWACLSLRIRCVRGFLLCSVRILDICSTSVVKWRSAALTLYIRLLNCTITCIVTS